MRKRGHRRPGRNAWLFDQGRPSTYVKPITALLPGGKALIWCRVSTTRQAPNLADQERILREAVAARGAVVVGTVAHVGPATRAAAALYKATRQAERVGAALLAESVSRFARHPEYDPKRRPDVAPGTTALRDLAQVTGGVPLVTLHDPDATWTEERGAQTSRGRRAKLKLAECPTGRPGYKKARRRLMLRKVYWLEKTGHTVRETARLLGEHPTQVQRWKNRLRAPL